MSSLTIVMYHYVRDLENSRFPRIKGLDIAKFKRQLDHIEANYTPVSYNEINCHLSDPSYTLPENACWLTFDDGYIDHYQFVFPELLKRNMQGAFFPPVKPIMEREVLDVNKIHYILASEENTTLLVNDIKELLAYHEVHALTNKDFESYWDSWAKPSRYDTSETMFVKHMLQHALPESMRNLFSETLFAKYVSNDIHGFADDLYLSVSQIKEMINAGMYFGSHGYRHLWLDKESADSQTAEIDKSLLFLSEIGAPTDSWVMCYPYGAYNQESLKILGEKRCLVGLTTKVGVANTKLHPKLELPRLDTNDLPQ